jgi:hypothetical protein
MENLMSSLRTIFGTAAILTAMAAASLGTSWGASWSEVNAGLPSAGLSVNALTIDPASPSTIYAQTSGGPGGVALSSAFFKNMDAGEPGGWASAFCP